MEIYDNKLEEDRLPLHYKAMSLDFNNENIKRRNNNSNINSTTDNNSLNDGYDKFNKDFSYISRRPPSLNLIKSNKTSDSIWNEILPTKEELIPHITPLVYTFISALTRFLFIAYESSVVWDEAHFGKFGSYYLKRQFYFDVHPPLGKMLVGLAGALSGYNGSFEFKSGEPYPNDLHYGIFRGYLASFGVLIVPLAWYTAQELGLSKRSCHLVTLMVLFDNALATISRFILLDSMLLFFTFTTIFFLTKFHNERRDPFGFDWWMWLILSGISIGCVCSVKWVGLFVTSVVGIYTIDDLWQKFGDLKMPKKTYGQHWIARIVCLIVVPIVVYVASFKVHFAILNRSGTGDAQMSSLFQANLKGNKFYKSPLEIAYGSKITLKQMGYGGGLLHSHVQNFPVGSLQGQVTCYHYQDENNQFNVLPTWEESKINSINENENDFNDDEIKFLHDGDILRLQHVPYGRYIHSHDIPAPLSKLEYEVAAYGNSTYGDSNDYWIVEVVDDIYRGKLKSRLDKIHSLTTRLRFRHMNLGCYLKAANKNLPEWGFKQIEVTCDKENNVNDVHTYWNVESHWNDKLPPGNKKLYKSSFLNDFWHLNVAMMMSNNALIPNPDKEDILASKPLDWPFLHLGLRMNGWGDHNAKYYLLGNPIVWWSTSISLFIFVSISAWHIIRQRRCIRDITKNEWDYFCYVGMITFGGWAFHYIPFLIMGRVTYLHHYLPALYFAILVLGLVLDHLVFKRPNIKPQTKWLVFAILAVGTIATFIHFKSIVFGMTGKANEYKGLQWRKSWVSDFSNKSKLH